MIEQYMIWIWLAVFVIALIVEATTQDLVSVWFSLGAIVCIILSVIDGFAYYYEIIIFAVVSFALLFFTRPVVKKLLKNQERTTNVDDFIGRECIALEPITKFNNGSIKINDVIYTAILPESEDDEISVGDKVKIVTVKGNKVVVRKM